MEQRAVQTNSRPHMYCHVLRQWTRGTLDRCIVEEHWAWRALYQKILFDTTATLSLYHPSYSYPILPDIHSDVRRSASQMCDETVDLPCATDHTPSTSHSTTLYLYGHLICEGFLGAHTHYLYIECHVGDELGEKFYTTSAI